MLATGQYKPDMKIRKPDVLLTGQVSKNPKTGRPVFGLLLYSTEEKLMIFNPNLLDLVFRGLHETNQVCQHQSTENVFMSQKIYLVVESF